jgi:hypothetical protein
MDVKLIYKTECLAEYLCAYVTKSEKASKQVINAHESSLLS